jgi:hypothetical protein
MRWGQFVRAIPRAPALPAYEPALRIGPSPPRVRVLAAHPAAAREATVKHIIEIVLASALLVGCAALKSGTPYNAQEACEGSGGTYSSDGTCQAGRE